MEQAQVDYFYDALGRRVAKAVGLTVTLEEIEAYGAFLAGVNATVNSGAVVGGLATGAAAGVGWGLAPDNGSSQNNSTPLSNGNDAAVIDGNGNVAWAASNSGYTVGANFDESQ